MDTFLSTLPFSGFYESLHDDLLDRSLDSIFQDRQSGDPNEGLVRRAFDAVDWRQVHVQYASSYAKSFSQKFGLKLEFDELRSPREYNFETDRIFVRLANGEPHRLGILMKAHFEELFTGLCEERFTSRSGFMSFYKPDWHTWGPLESWDHNQLGTLVAAWAQHESNTDFDQYAEQDLMESDRDNSRIEDWIIRAMRPEVWARLERIHTYLEDRKEKYADHAVAH